MLVRRRALSAHVKGTLSGRWFSRPHSDKTRRASNVARRCHDRLPSFIYFATVFPVTRYRSKIDPTLSSLTMNQTTTFFSGFLKWMIGICVPEVSRWGLDALLETHKMTKYFERDLKSRNVVFNEYGQPVHPDTGRKSVRICCR